jgi:hypothetical protein
MAIMPIANPAVLALSIPVGAITGAAIPAGPVLALHRQLQWLRARMAVGNEIL